MYRDKWVVQGGSSGRGAQHHAGGLHGYSIRLPLGPVQAFTALPVPILTIQVGVVAPFVPPAALVRGGTVCCSTPIIVSVLRAKHAAVVEAHRIS